jgi:hypothetical protein
MLQITDNLTGIKTVVVPPPRRVTGQYLAKNRLDAHARAQLAADVLAGKVAIDGSTLTVMQVVRLCRSNTKYVNAARFPDRVRKAQQRKLELIFNAIGPDARAEACRTIGIERVWSALAQALG